MRIITLVLYLLEIAGGASSQPLRQVSDLADSGETGKSSNSEGSAKDLTRSANPARNYFPPYMDERPSFEEQRFVARFNNLLKALHDFASTYRPGLVIDAKKAKEIRKAMRGLEKSPWFRLQKED